MNTDRTVCVQPDGDEPRHETAPNDAARRSRATPAHAPTRARLGADELAVVALIRQRLELGAEQYGALDVAGDARDWTHEALEEALDLAVYLAAALLRRHRKPVTHAHARVMGSHGRKGKGGAR